MSSLILSDNFVDTDRVAEISSSSENSSFPLTNILDKTRRSKVWRSSGYYEVPSGGLTLNFEETASTVLSASIAAGEYTTFALFAAAIKTGLEAAGASTYTVTQDSTTLKAKIASNGAGGGGILNLNWDTSTEMAALLGYDSSAQDSGALTYTADVLRINSGEWIKIDMGISTNPEAFAIVSRRNTPLKFSGTATITLQGNETDVWTGPTYSKVITLKDDILALTKEESAVGLHTEALRYWRVLFEDLDNPYNYIEAGAMFLGHSLPMVRGKVQIPFSADYIDTSITVFSEGGQSFSDERAVSESFGVSMFGLTKVDKEAFDAFFEEFKTAKAFFFQFDSKAAMGTDGSVYFRYVKMSGPPRWEMPFPGVFAVDFQVREEL